jgi:hypothetical protein
MRRRFDYLKEVPGGDHAITSLERYLERCSLALSRGCVYCIEMPWRELRIHRFLTSF